MARRFDWDFGLCICKVDLWEAGGKSLVAVLLSCLEALIARTQCIVGGVIYEIGTF